MHETALPEEKVPSGQARGGCAAFGQKEPAGQLVQTPAPSALYWPAAQAVSVVRSGDAYPAYTLVQLVTPPLEKEPAGQEIAME